MITNMSNVTLLDAQATPVSQTFTPASRVAENTARWIQKPTSGALLGAKTLSLSVKEPADPASGVFRIKVSFAIPKLDVSVPSAPKLVATGRVNCEFLVPVGFTTQECKDLVKMFEQSLVLGSSTAIGDNIVDRSLPY